MYCSKCGTEIGNANYCPNCGTPQAGLAVQSTASAAQPAPAPQVVVLRPAKNPGVALVLSFFVAGLGQLYNGEIGKGIAFLIAYFVSVLLMWAVIGFLTTPILWVWGMVDAYKSAERLNTEAGVR